MGARFRLILAGLLAAALWPVAGPDLPAPAGAAELGRWCLAELATGAALGLVAALVNLGYRQADAEKAAAAAMQEVGAGAPLADLLRTSLKKLSRA